MKQPNNLGVLVAIAVVASVLIQELTHPSWQAVVALGLALGVLVFSMTLLKRTEDVQSAAEDRLKTLEGKVAMLLNAQGFKK